MRIDLYFALLRHGTSTSSFPSLHFDSFSFVLPLVVTSKVTTSHMVTRTLPLAVTFGFWQNQAIIFQLRTLELSFFLSFFLSFVYWVIINFTCTSVNMFVARLITVPEFDKAAPVNVGNIFGLPPPELYTQVIVEPLTDIEFSALLPRGINGS